MRKKVNTMKTFIMGDWADQFNKCERMLRNIMRVAEDRLNSAPPGDIHMKSCNGSLQYYLRRNASARTGDYISKKDEKMIRLYLQKKYDSAIVRLLSEDLHKMEKGLGFASVFFERITSLYTSFPLEAQKFITPFVCPDEEYVKMWLAEQYEGLPFKEDDPIYYTDREDRKERVRSKSELNIANTLLRRGIPYRYEYPTLLKNGQTVYPDFMLLLVSLRKIYYWEHRGMMDNLDYVDGTVKKIKRYNRSGIIVGKNLIITEETGDYPLGTDEIENIIDSILRA